MGIEMGLIKLNWDYVRNGNQNRNENENRKRNGKPLPATFYLTELDTVVP